MIWLQLIALDLTTTQNTSISGVLFYSFVKFTRSSFSTERNSINCSLHDEINVINHKKEQDKSSYI